MRLHLIIKVLIIASIFLGILDFVLYFITYDKIYETFGGYIILITLPLGFLSLVISIFFWIKNVNGKLKLKRNYKFNTFLILSGFCVLALLIYSYFEINKYSRLTIQNNSEDDLTKIEITSLSNTINKKIDVIYPGKNKRIYLNKYLNHEWNIKYNKGEKTLSDTIRYYRYFRQATNDKIIINKDSLIKETYEMLIWNN